MSIVNILEDRELNKTIIYKFGRNSTEYFVTNVGQLDFLMSKKIVDEKLKEQIMQDSAIEKMPYNWGMMLLRPFIWIVASGGVVSYRSDASEGS
jgi:hypothetical protein